MKAKIALTLALAAVWSLLTALLLAAVLLACLALLAGCSGVGIQVPGDGPLVLVVYDDSFAEHRFPDGRREADAVREGIRFWNGLGANLWAPEDAPQGQVVAATYRVARDDFSWPGSGVVGGITWPCLGYLTIYPNSLRSVGYYDYEDVREVVAHEVGHAIGLYHVDANAVMSASVSWPEKADYPSAADVAEYRRVYGSRGGG